MEALPVIGVLGKVCEVHGGSPGALDGYTRGSTTLQGPVNPAGWIFDVLWGVLGH
jgi:hypothetical protein